MPKKSKSDEPEEQPVDPKAALRENIIEALRHARRGGHLNTADIDAILEYLGAPE